MIEHFLGVGGLEGKETMSIVEVGNNCTSTWGDELAYLCPAFKKKNEIEPWVWVV